MKKKIENIEALKVEITQAPSTVEKEIKINSFSGDFGRQDINLLRDKVNEIIDFINQQ